MKWIIKRVCRSAKEPLYLSTYKTFGGEVTNATFAHDLRKALRFEELELAKAIMNLLLGFLPPSARFRGFRIVGVRKKKNDWARMWEVIEKNNKSIEKLERTANDLLRLVLKIPDTGSF